MPLPSEFSPLAKKLLVLAFPAVLSNLAEEFMSLADVAILGRTGVSGMAGGAISANLFHQVFWLMNFLPLGMSANVSFLEGGGDRKRGFQILIKTMFIASIVGLSASIFLILFRIPILIFYQAGSEVIEISSGYYTFRLLGLAPGLVIVCLAYYLQGLRDTKTPFQAIALASLLNIPLSILFVFGIKDIAKGIGPTGAGIATLISQFFCLFLLLRGLLKFVSKEPDIIYSITFLNEIRSLKLKFLRGVGIDLFLRSISLNLVFFVGFVLASRISPSHIAAHNIVMQLWFFAALLTDGFAIAARSQSGIALGANNHELAQTSAKVSGIVATLLGVILSLIFALLYPILPNLFTHEPTVLTLISLPYLIFVLCQPINTISFVLDGVLKGAGDVAFLRKWLLIAATVFLPIAIGLTSIRDDLFGIWIGLGILMIIRTVSIVFRIYSGRWLTSSKNSFDTGIS